MGETVAVVNRQPTQVGVGRLFETPSHACFGQGTVSAGLGIGNREVAFCECELIARQLLEQRIEVSDVRILDDHAPTAALVFDVNL